MRYVYHRHNSTLITFLLFFAVSILTSFLVFCCMQVIINCEGVSSRSVSCFCIYLRFTVYISRSKSPACDHWSVYIRAAGLPVSPTYCLGVVYSWQTMYFFAVCHWRVILDYDTPMLTEYGGRGNSYYVVIFKRLLYLGLNKIQ